jgi:type IV pilus assembly protein PilE
MKTQQGFTLIELMIVVVIVGILTVVAMPAYTNYVTKSRLTEAFTSLSSAASSAEQFWSNNRTYVNFGASTGFPANSTNFAYTLTTSTATAFTITATGSNSVANFAFTIDQNGARTTTSVPSSKWGTAPASCWIYDVGGVCAQ